MKWKGDTYDPWITLLSHLDGKFYAKAFQAKELQKCVQILTLMVATLLSNWSNEVPFVGVSAFQGRSQKVMFEWRHDFRSNISKSKLFKGIAPFHRGQFIKKYTNDFFIVDLNDVQDK